MLLTLITVLAALGAVGICLGTGAFAALRWLWVLPVSFAGLWLALLLAAFAVLWLVCRRIDKTVPQEHDDPAFRRFVGVYIDAVIALTMRLHVSGTEKLPKSGRFLLVCNHLFVADPGIVLHCFRESQLAFLTKKENYKLPFIGAFMHKILCQPIDRENDRQALKSILRCIQLIKEDKVSVCAFPEGYTSKDGKVHPFRPGVFKIAQKTNVPIVVCTIQNTRDIFKNLKHFGHTDVELHLVEVIPPESYAGLNTVALSDMVYEKMISDLGESFRYSE